MTELTEETEKLFFSPKRKRISTLESKIKVANLDASGLLRRKTENELDHRCRHRRKSPGSLEFTENLVISPPISSLSFSMNSTGSHKISNDDRIEFEFEDDDADDNFSRLLSSSFESKNTVNLTDKGVRGDPAHRWLNDDVAQFSRSCDIFDDDSREQKTLRNRSWIWEDGRTKLSYSVDKRVNGSNHRTSSPSSFQFVDFGTPVDHVGSPAVIEGVDYSTNEDSILDSTSEHDQKTIIVAYEAVDYGGNRSLDNNSVPIFESNSPSGVQYVSDLSSNITGVQKANSKSGIVTLPLPDLAAFDNSKGKVDFQKLSPVCPPTPLRTPLWHSGLLGLQLEQSERSSIFHTAETSLLPIIRQNSLEDNKLLLAQSESPRFREVQFFRDFVLEGLIGNGAFAEVYQVQSREEISDRFAVKKIKRQFRSKKDRDWLLNEVKIMKKLGRSKCHYVVPFFRAWQEDSYFYVQLGLAERGSLKDLHSKMIFMKKTFPDYSIWHVLHNVSCGLTHIHEYGIVHLDIKPANLLIHLDGFIQIGDFGMATEVGSEEDGHEGDTRYMAPELLNFSKRDTSSDIFSLGLTILEISYSLEQIEQNNISLPTEGPQWLQLRSDQVPIPTSRPISLQDLIKSMLHSSPSMRPSAQSIVKSLPPSPNQYRDDDVILNAERLSNRMAVFPAGNFYPIMHQSNSQSDDRAITPY